MTAIMSKQADRMRDLITDLLTLSRIESDTQTSRDETVPVPALVESILEEARALTTTSRHVLIPDICYDYGLRGNSGELRTAFTNLVVNAIRHTPGRAEIRIRWTVDNDGARFCVSDTGEGIAPRHIPRLGERFYRTDSSRSRDTGGTGLGLAIVRQVLVQHDAILEISSRPGHGSTFCCCFPAGRTTGLTELEGQKMHADT
jgi:two-component system phosphate regulon sensor histidine kinase PhoR